MKHLFKLFILTILLTTYSCSNDDNEETNIISLTDASFNINENPSNGQAIGTITATQTVGGATLNYAIDSQTPIGALAINSSTGELTVADASLFDFETNPELTAIVSAAGSTNTATVTITVSNLSELNVENFTETLDENPNSGAILGTVIATGDNTLTYSISSETPVGALSINASTGELSVLDESLFDYETNPMITADILIDNNGTTETSTVTINLEDIHEVGEYKFGGVIFWVNIDGTEGYAVSMNNQSAAAPYGCMHTATSATGTAIGTGQANTNAILAICTSTGIAADLCASLNSNGYDDWFLPSQDEMREIMDNKALINTTLTNNGGTAFSISNANFWTSTEVNAAEARIYNFNNDWFPSDFKSLNRPVRAVRFWSDN